MATGAWEHNFPASKDVHPTYIDYPNVGWDKLIVAMFHDVFTALDAIQNALGYDITGAYDTLKEWLDALTAASHTQGTDTTLGTLTAGIPFPASQVPSADANTLDDYEEGNWTLRFEFGGASVGVTYLIQAGRYVKIGKWVMVTGRALLTSKGTSVGNARIEGLPVTCLNADGGYSAIAVRMVRVSYADTLLGAVLKNTTSIYLQETTNAGVVSYITNADFSDTADLMLHVVYETQ